VYRVLVRTTEIFRIVSRKAPKTEEDGPQFKPAVTGAGTIDITPDAEGKADAKKKVCCA